VGGVVINLIAEALSNPQAWMEMHDSHRIKEIVSGFGDNHLGAALFTALFLQASGEDRAREISDFLSRVINPNLVDPTNSFAPTAAFYASTPSMIALLHEKGVNFNYTRSDGCAPLEAFLMSHNAKHMTPRDLSNTLRAFQEVGADFSAVAFNTEKHSWGFLDYGMNTDQINVLKEFPFDQEKLSKAIACDAARGAREYPPKPSHHISEARKQAPVVYVAPGSREIN
jgi:hypothetical protein